MKERIQKILSHFKLSSAQFADITGVQRSSISHLLSGRNKPSYDFLVKILENYPQISADWLLTGRGDFIKPKTPLNTSHSDTNLFNQTSNEAVKEEDRAVYNTQQPLNPNNLTNKKVTNVKPSSEIQNTASMVTNVNGVKQVIVLYDNDTFKIYNQS